VTQGLIAEPLLKKRRFVPLEEKSGGHFCFVTRDILLESLYVTVHEPTSGVRPAATERNARTFREALSRETSTPRAGIGRRATNGRLDFYDPL